MMVVVDVLLLLNVDIVMEIVMLMLIVLKD